MFLNTKTCAYVVTIGMKKIFLEFTFELGEKAFDFGDVHFVWFGLVGTSSAARARVALAVSKNGSVGTAIGFQLDELCKIIDRVNSRQLCKSSYV